VLRSLRLYTSDKHWRVDIEVWASDLRVYRSVGVRAVVCHLERITTIWGGTQTEWEEEPADVIHVRNVYSDAAPGVATREREWQVAARAELREWSTSGRIHLVADNEGTQTGAEIPAIHRVESTVTVKIGEETLMGVLTASSVGTEVAASAAA
jgi:hypothetical protein